MLSLNNSPFAELEIKDTTDSHNFASYLDLLLEIGDGNKLSTRLTNEITSIFP